MVKTSFQLMVKVFICNKGENQNDNRLKPIWQWKNGKVIRDKGWKLVYTKTNGSSISKEDPTEEIFKKRT